MNAFALRINLPLKKQVEQREFAQYQGKIIRNIEIYPLDPFGFDEKDLNKKPTRSIDRWGNALHGRTKKVHH
ncbi:hypothetical protein QIU19_01345 [Capnocytophaga canimorsus]|nr:hypothetical protein [Capnocytophaga canimorsus]WGU68659.1 hypothetical protein QIU19_01345 [Capnocytophaga canimorsus]